MSGVHSVSAASENGRNGDSEYSSNLLERIVDADDCNVYVKSKIAGERVMQSITEYLEKKLKLKVNQDKNAVERPWRRKFLGFAFYNKKDGVGIRVHAKPLGKFKDRAREILSRSNGRSMEQRIRALNYLIIGG